MWTRTHGSINQFYFNSEWWTGCSIMKMIMSHSPNFTENNFFTQFYTLLCLHFTPWVGRYFFPFWFCCFQLIEDLSNCSASSYCEWISVSIPGLCLSVSVHHSASGKKSRGKPEDRKTNPSRPPHSFFLALSFHRSHLMAEGFSFNAPTAMSFCWCFVVSTCVYIVIRGYAHSSHVNCLFAHQIQPTFTFPLELHLYPTSFIFLLPTPLIPFLSPRLPPTILPYAMHHLCRAGRHIITTACEYWSTAPVCMCYFKIFRPVISVLMIVIAKATSSVWFFSRPVDTSGQAGSLNTHTKTNRRKALREWMEAC